MYSFNFNFFLTCSYENIIVEISHIDKCESVKDTYRDIYIYSFSFYFTSNHSARAVVMIIINACTCREVILAEISSREENNIFVNVLLMFC